MRYDATYFMRFTWRDRVINPVATLSSERPPVSADIHGRRDTHVKARDINPINLDFADADRLMRSDGVNREAVALDSEK